MSKTTQWDKSVEETWARGHVKTEDETALGAELKKHVQAKIWTPGPGSNTQEVLNIC